MKFFILITTVLLATMRTGLCQDLVYKPINPSFGGNTFNYQWLLSSAQEQNDYKEKTNLSMFDQDPVKQFEQDLNRQILSQLSRKLVADIFGEEGLKDGTFELGGFQIEITNNTEGVNINILNINNGSSTSIIVPFF